MSKLFDRETLQRLLSRVFAPDFTPAFEETMKRLSKESGR